MTFHTWWSVLGSHFFLSQNDHFLLFMFSGSPIFKAFSKMSYSINFNRLRRRDAVYKFFMLLVMDYRTTASIKSQRRNELHATNSFPLIFPNSHVNYWSLIEPWCVQNDLRISLHKLSTEYGEHTLGLPGGGIPADFHLPFSTCKHSLYIPDSEPDQSFKYHSSLFLLTKSLVINTILMKFC